MQTDPVIPEEYRRRLEKVEDAVDNGRFIRKDIFELVIHEMRADNAKVAGELEEMRNERKGLRNLILAALFSAAGSLIVALLVASANRP